MVTHLNKDEQAGFTFAVQLYTKLLFDQKELINGIIEVAYAQGIQEGVAYAQQAMVNAQQSEQMPEEPEEEYVPQNISVPQQPQQQPPQQPQQPTQPAQPQQPKSFADRLRAIPRR